MNKIGKQLKMRLVEVKNKDNLNKNESKNNSKN